MHCKITVAQQLWFSKQFLFISYLFLTIYAFSFANSVSYSVVSNVSLTDCSVKFANAGKRKNATGYVKIIYAKEQLKRYHGDRNHLKRNKLTIVANNKNSTFDRNYEGQTLSCYIISYLIHAIFQDILCILRK